MRSLLGACSLVMLLGVTAMATGAATARAEATGDALLDPTPLILKDGRIANVSVHVLPFAAGATTIGPATNARLAGLTRQMATDCFLTAQVIGHVAPSEVAGDDTLAAHRMARSRADAIQASLIEGGLPARSIASVWDWQFMVREARATLWMFRLTPGEDCEDTPLGGAPVVAAVEPPAGAAASFVGQANAAPQPPAATPPAEPQATSTQPAGSVAQGTRAPETAAPSIVAPSTVATAATAVAAGPAPNHGPSVTQTIPAGQPKTAPPTAPAAAATPASGDQATTVASLAQSPARVPVPATKPAVPKGRVAVLAEDVLAITFATNSSYFPPGTGERLAKLVAAHGGAGPQQIVIDVGVSGQDKVIGAQSADEAARYNRWLAERRLERVRDWLDKHAGDDFAVTPTFHEDDDSRQLTVSIVPAA